MLLLDRSYLQKRYVLALFLVALLSAGNHACIHVLIEWMESDAVEINVSGRQRMLSQGIALFAYLYVASTEPLNREKYRRELMYATTQVQRNHAALMEGDEGLGLPGISEENIRMAYFDEDTGVDRDMRSLVEKVNILLAEDREDLSVDHPALVHILNLAPGNLLAKLDHVVKQQELNSLANVRFLRNVGVAMLIVTLLTILLEAFFIFRPMTLLVVRKHMELWASKEKLRKAKQDTDLILQNIREGLFTIGQDLSLSKSWSLFTEMVFDPAELSRGEFVPMIQKRLSKKKQEAFSIFMELLFNGRVDEEYLTNLNPVARMKFMVRGEPRHYETSFRRILRKGEIQSILFSIKDVSAEVRLKKNLGQERQKNKEHIQRIMVIINSDMELLGGFFTNTMQILERLGSVYLILSERGELNREEIDEVTRFLHTLKGNSEVLALEDLAQKTHRFEDFILKLATNGEISTKSMKEYKFFLDELHLVVHNYQETIQKLERIRISLRTMPSMTVDDVFLKSLEMSVKRIGENSGKRVSFLYEQFSFKSMPKEIRDTLKDILPQLVRNSIFHGIEKPEVRTQNAKIETGTIRIKCEKSGSEFVVTFEDDGQGLNLSEIALRAAGMGLVERERLEDMGAEELANLIFSKGLSTAEKSELTAGRGMGMDVIKSRIESLGGSIDIETKENEYTKFLLKIPAS